MELRELFRILRRRWTIVAGFLLLGILAAVAFVLVSPKEYTATATVNFKPSAPVSSQTGTLSQQSQYVLQRVLTYEKLATSSTVLQPVIDKDSLNTTPGTLSGNISVANPTGTAVLTITATDGKASRAAQIANDVGDQLTQQVATLETVNITKSNGDATTRTIVAVTGTVTSRASTPSAATSPKTTVDIALGFIVGLLLGVGLAIARDRYDRSFKTVDELEHLTGARPLGVVKQHREAGRRPLLALHSPGAAESYRSIRDRLHLVDATRPVRRVLVTSATSGEGRSITACNLAVVLAQGGARVCLIDADLRRPSIGSLLDIANRNGLSNVLAGTAEFATAVVPWDEGFLDVLTAGTLASDPSDLLASTRMRDLVDDLAVHYDYIVIDAPPVLPVSDAAIVARVTDGAVLVTRAGQTRADEVERALDVLVSARCRVLGTVFTSARQGDADQDRYKYRPAAATRADRRRRQQQEQPAGDPNAAVFGDEHASDATR